MNIERMKLEEQINSLHLEKRKYTEEPVTTMPTPHGRRAHGSECDLYAEGTNNFTDISLDIRSLAPSCY